MKFDLISAKELPYYMHQPQTLLLDLRSAEEYRERHLKEAINIPYDCIGKCSQFPKEYQLILYCERGSVSMVAAREMASSGYRVKTVIGGIRACSEKLIETEK